MVKRRWFKRSGRLRCAFCGQDEAQVEKLIGSRSGATICGHCVGLCNRILDGQGEAEFTDFSRLGDEELLGTLMPASQSIEALQGLLFERVDALRERGVSWARIGTALGVSRQAAWERFS